MHMPPRNLARMWHPWLALHSLLGIALIWTEKLPANVLAATDGHRIWMPPLSFASQKHACGAHTLGSYTTATEGFHSHTRGRTPFYGVRL